MLFKVGNVYKAYGHDAKNTANKIDIALYAPTSDTPLLSAEIPAHAIDFYANALRKRGSEVVVFDKPLNCIFQEMKEAA